MKSIKSNTVPGLVVALKANYFFVEIEDPSLHRVKILCTKRNRLNFQGLYISVGDKVIVEAIDWKRLRGVITEVKPRINWLERPAVANVSHIMVLMSVADPLFNIDQASRFLMTAENIDIEVTLVLTKIDLVPKQKLDLYLKNMKSWGYDALSISLDLNYGIESFISKLRASEISVLCGPSGVGKTSIINYLLPHQLNRTSPVSKKLKRGVNTTRHVELFDIGGGALVADTPGFNKPELIINPSDLANLFPEFRRQLILKQCKFRDCLHRGEPGCVIDKSLERYSFYREYLEELINPLR